MSKSRLLLVLDIDENIVSIQRSPEDGHRVLESALKDLSDSSGQIDDPGLIKDYALNKITAFRQPDWKRLFKKIVSINHAYHSQHRADSTPLISVIFLTNALYDGRIFIEKVFEPFFTKKMTDDLFPDYKNNTKRFFFNRIDQEQLIAKHYMKNGVYNEDFLTNTYDEEHLARARRLFPGEKFTQFIARNVLTFLKGLFLELKFEEFKTHFGITDTMDVLLADDNTNNIAAVIERGFGGIHNPSTELGDHHATYEAGRITFFAQLREQVNKPNIAHDLNVVTPVNTPVSTPANSPAKKRQREENDACNSPQKR